MNTAPTSAMKAAADELRRQRDLVDDLIALVLQGYLSVDEEERFSITPAGRRAFGSPERGNQPGYLEPPQRLRRV